MPSRINGIGTAYLGRSSLLSRPALCDACKRGVVLSTYNTRLWFTILFIPVVPLGRKRILDYCPSCTTHRAVPLAEWHATRDKAMEETARRALAEPGNAEAQIDLHRTCLVMGEWDRADAFLKKLEGEFARDAKVQLYLAGAHAYRGKAAEAEAAMARARELDPGIVPPPVPGPASGTARAGTSRRTLVLAGVLVALVLGVMSVASLRKAGHRKVYVVTRQDGAVHLQIDGLPPMVFRGPGYRRFEIPEGLHRAKVLEPAGPDIEFAIESNFFTRLFDERAFILNPGSTAFLVVEETAYSAKPVDPKHLPPYRLLYGMPFYAVEDIDYPFAPFPAQIKTKESGVIRKRRLDVVLQDPTDIMAGLAGNGRVDDALALGEWAVRSLAPERVAVLGYFVDLAGRQGKADRALALLKERIAVRPVEVESHRLYQGLPSKRADLAAEYDAALQKSPDDADLLYLRGRLESRLSLSRRWYEKALKSDPKHPWAHFALGFVFASSGDWASAGTMLAKACEGRPDVPEFRILHRRARLATGDVEGLEKDLRAELEKAPLRLSLHQELVRVLVAAGRTEQAREHATSYRQRLKTGVEVQEAASAARGLESALLYALGDFAALEKLAPADPKEIPGDRAVALLEQGRVEEALKAAAEPDVLLLLAAALESPGDTPLLEKAAAALDAIDRDAGGLAAALRSGAEAAVEEAVDAPVDAPVKAAALALLAARVPSRARELRERAAALNRVPAFPYHLLKRRLAAP